MCNGKRGERNSLAVGAKKKTKKDYTDTDHERVVNPIQTKQPPTGKSPTSKRAASGKQDNPIISFASRDARRVEFTNLLNSDQCVVVFDTCAFSPFPAETER